MKINTYYSNGKLLISGEYLVLDGALSLAIPTTYGQSLKVESIDGSHIIWNSLDERGLSWLHQTFEYQSDGTLHQSNPLDDGPADKLIHILNTAKQFNPNFLKVKEGFKITTSLTFPRNWGLGSSSTLINNVAQWAQVDPYLLLERTFGGSGYDIACAQYNQAISYQLEKGRPIVKEVPFDPPFKDYLYFVYLNKKQNSREGIKMYRENTSNATSAITEISKLTTQMVDCKSLNDFNGLVVKHEQIISNLIKQPSVKSFLFNDFNGQIKSLGAWGGDFILVSSITNPIPYFKSKGLDTVIPYKEMVLKSAS